MVENSIEKSMDKEIRWVRAPEASHYSPYVHPETFKEKAIRKTKANPIVPIGVLITSTVLGIGLYSMKSGNRQLSQYMMRARVAAQGFTILALIGGVFAVGKAAK